MKNHVGLIRRAGIGLSLLSLLALTAIRATGEEIALQDSPGEHLDVIIDGRLAARYVYAHDRTSLERLHETYKPFLHVFDAAGEKPITKGAGGNFTHHRGIFVGWNKIHFNGRTYDRWHMKGGEIVHQGFSGMRVSDSRASFTSVTAWNDEHDQPILSEERTMTIHRASAPARLIVDFTTVLTASRGDVLLDGDPEHAGVHYRPADDVVARETVYLFPKEGADPKKDRDYPWVGQTHTLRGRQHSVVHMNHPQNPRGTIYSAYRDYGRFGAFFRHSIKKRDSLTLKYRFVISDGPMPPTEFIERVWDQFAGVAAPTPVPGITIIPVAANAAK